MGYSRDSFNPFKEFYNNCGELAIKEISRKKPIPNNRVEDHIEQPQLSWRLEKQAYGQQRGLSKKPLPQPGRVSNGRGPVAH
jgi:hypothetical protein